MTFAVILAGGRGERFWPLSRRTRPKQLLPITSDRTMLEETVSRLSPLVRSDRIIVVSTHILKNKVEPLLPAVPEGNFLFEPMGRNTALAIGYAAVHLSRMHPKARMIVLPADHYVEDKHRFLESVKVALDVAQSKLLVTFGIVPDRPETQYGYVRLGKRIHKEDGIEVYAARAFTEKPNRKRATEFLSSGDFLWNSGMFVWRADAILEAIGEQMPGLHARLMDYAQSMGKPGEAAALRRLYRQSENVSVDYGVMETAMNVAVVKCDFKWDDVGSWPALTRLREEDGSGNVVVGNHVGEDTRDTVVFSESGLVATFGISDLVIVQTSDVTLVAKKSKCPDIRELVDRLYERDDLKKYA